MDYCCSESDPTLQEAEMVCRFIRSLGDAFRTSPMQCPDAPGTLLFPALVVKHGLCGGRAISPHSTALAPSHWMTRPVACKAQRKVADRAAVASALRPEPSYKLTGNGARLLLTERGSRGARPERRRPDEGPAMWAGERTRDKKPGFAVASRLGHGTGSHP